MSRVFALFLAMVILAALLPERFVFAEMIFKPLVVPNISFTDHISTRQVLWNWEWLIKLVIVFLLLLFYTITTWKTVVISCNSTKIDAKSPDFWKGCIHEIKHRDKFKHDNVSLRSRGMELRNGRKKKRDDVPARLERLRGAPSSLSHITVDPITRTF